MDTCLEKPQGHVFAARFLETGPEWNVPDGRYDPQRQIYVRAGDGEPAFVNEELCTQNGDEITTHHTTNVSGVTFRDPDNG
jgi:hypothetical protein